ncbi:orotate phosphoribosyltransferase [Physcia stellaris]|nr:orotate phosphoribosyltransferase [Physcia stellaris]
MASSDHPPIPNYKNDFLQSCLSANVLQFGTFTLKSGRVSPYFFNAGLFHTGSLLSSISTAYAYSIIDFLSSSSSSSNPSLEIDILFGPAYKGIPLACSTVEKLASISPSRFANLSYAYNRKEAKTHGEAGSIVGAPLKGKRVMVIDDVITAGTAMREAISIIQAEGGILVGVIVALDRMERMPSKEDGDRGSAIGEVRRKYGVPVLSIVTLDDLVGLLRRKGDEEDLRRLEGYRAEWLAKD